MATIKLIYGSTTGNTETAAEQIASALGAHDVTTVSASDASAADFADAENLILGTSTWGVGDLQDDWEGLLSDLEGADLSGKTVALFGCGDSASYSDTFVDGMGTLYNAVIAAGGKVVGSTSTDGYSHSDSIAIVDGQFVGLAIDDDGGNNDERMAAWVAAISPEFN